MSEPIRTTTVPRREGELIKPGEIVTVEGAEGWTLADRRVWNLLLVNAWSDRLEDPTAVFSVDLAELRGSHRGNERIRETLDKLQTTLVLARLPNGKARKVQMLGGTDLDDEERTAGTLEYEFSKMLVPLLRDSEIYARMEVKVLSAFTSKYALNLYEALAARINLRKTSETVDLTALRRWLGVPSGKLPLWQNLKVRALEPAVQEVNAYSPIDGRGRFGQTETQGHRGQDVMVQEEALQPRRAGRRPRGQPPQRRPQGPDHGRGRAGRRRRRRAHRGRARASRRIAAAHPRRGVGGDRRAPRHPRGPCRLAERWVAGMKEPIRSPAGHFVDFCKRRAKELK